MSLDDGSNAGNHAWPGQPSPGELIADFITPFQLRVRVASCAALLAIPASFGTLCTPCPPPVPVGCHAALAARENGLFDLPAHPALSVSAQQSDWPRAVIMVGFTDSTVALFRGADAAVALRHDARDRDGIGGGLLRGFARPRAPRFEIVATVQLAHTLNYYANDRYGVDFLSTPSNDWGLVRDAVQAADPHVDWRRYDRDGDSYVDMIWVMHAGIGGEGASSMRSLWSITAGCPAAGATAAWSRPTSSCRLRPPAHARDRFSILPELSMFKPGAMSEIGVYCHEFRHALGCPDPTTRRSWAAAPTSGRATGRSCPRAPRR